VASGAVMNFVTTSRRAPQRIDQHLTDIMMAQDFHDLTGQVVAKVVNAGQRPGDSLVKLLVQVVPPEQREKVDPACRQKQCAWPVTSRWARSRPTSC
jgi:chemotaxis protein CheZ